MRSKCRPYLCGAIQGCTDGEAHDWRDRIKIEFSGAYDPTVRDYRKYDDQNTIPYREIVELDKRDIRLSDMLLVHWVAPSVGTSMEIFYGWTLGKPIILWLDSSPPIISPWLKYHSSCVVHSYQCAIDKVSLYAPL